MNYNILVIPPFDRQLKRLLKKYPSLKKDYASFLDGLSKEPTQGTSIGNNCYKVRLAISSKGKGKSGGARVITYVQIIEKTVYLLSLYDKSEKENITEAELSALLQFIP